MSSIVLDKSEARQILFYAISRAEKHMKMQREKSVRFHEKMLSLKKIYRQSIKSFLEQHVEAHAQYLYKNSRFYKIFGFRIFKNRAREKSIKTAKSLSEMRFLYIDSALLAYGRYAPKIIGTRPWEPKIDKNTVDFLSLYEDFETARIIRDSSSGDISIIKLDLEKLNSIINSLKYANDSINISVEDLAIISDYSHG